MLVNSGARRLEGNDGGHGREGRLLKGYGSVLAGAAIAGVMALQAILAIPATGQRTPFYTRGEPREALVVQTIVRGDGFVLPMRNGDELPSKPPMFHWLGALASKLQGRLTEGSIRSPSVAASLLAVGATASVAWMWWGAGTAVLATVILSTSFQWLASSVAARVDMVLAAAITLALLLFARAIETGRRIPASAYALMTVATLTKGPAGFVLPCGIALVTLAIRGELRFLGWRDLRLLLAAVAAAAVWYAAAWAIGGDEFFAKQVLKENVLRVLDADSVDAGHVEPFWYYVPLLFAGLAPWSLFVPGLALFAWATRRNPAPASADHAAVAVEGTTWSSHRPDTHTTFLAVWVLVPFVLFSIADSKRAVYLLPAYPACAMLLAYEWSRVFRDGAGRTPSALLLAGSVAAAVVVALASVVVFAGAFGIPVDGWLRGIVSDADVNNVGPMLTAMAEHRLVVMPCAIILAAAAWMLVRAAQAGRWVRVVAATSVAMFALTATTQATLLPALASKRTTRGFLARVESHVPVETPLSFYRAFDYGAVFYRGAAIPVRQDLRDVPEIDGAWLLTWPAYLPALAEEARKPRPGGEAAGAYEVEEVIPSEDHDPSDKTSLVLVRIKRRIGDERSDGN